MRIGWQSIALVMAPALALGSAASSQQHKAAPTLKAAPVQCAPAPKIDYSPLRWADPRDEYDEKSANYARFTANFRAAYNDACKNGWLTKTRLSDPRAAHPDTLFLATAPDANIASIYFDEAEDTPKTGRELLLEWAFVNDGNIGQVPSVANLRAAIKCYVDAKAGHEASADCLPD